MIHVQVRRDQQEQVSELVFSVSGPSIGRIAELFQRALNCWPDAHPELKELGDMLTEGRVMQDYYHQAGIARTVE